MNTIPSEAFGCYVCSVQRVYWAFANDRVTVNPVVLA